ncbi:MAG: hypothetical protein RIQ79_1137, partial [Verrucomicrobiota bacterium]
SLTVPSFDSEVPLMDLIKSKIDVRRLSAHDVAVVIDPAAFPASSGEPKPSQPFAGLLKSIVLPASLRADGVDLAGTIRVLGAQPLDAAFTLKGGGIAAGAEGSFTLTLNASAKQGKLISELLLRPILGADGQLSALTVVLNATAESISLAAPAKLKTEFAITRAGEGETYLLRIASGAAPLIELASSWAPGATQTPGTWKIDLTDADLAPFLLGQVVPTFRVTGAGELTAAAADRFRIGGQLAVSASALERLAGAPALGPVKADLRFGFEMNAGQPRVESLALTLSSSTPVLSVEVRQPFGFDLVTQKLLPSRPGADLCDIVVLGLPVAWLKSFLPVGLTLGGPVTGAWVVRAEDDSFAAAASAPLVLPGLRMDASTGPQFIFDAIRIEGSRARFGPAGLIAGFDRLRVQRNGEDVLSGSVDLTRKPAAPLTARGELRAALSALTSQPVFGGASRLSGGTALLTFDTTVSDSLTAKALLSLVGLRAGSAGELPELTLNAEVSKQADGVLIAKFPLSIRNKTASRSSDIELAATLTPKDGQTRIAARLSSLNLHVQDLQAFAALAPVAPPAPAAGAPAAAAPAPAAPAVPAANPLWAGYGGELVLSFARVVYAPGVDITNIEGTIGLTPESLSAQGIKMAVGGGFLKLGGALNFLRPSGAYGLVADVSAHDIASGPLLRALSPTQTVPLEGVFALDAKLAGQGSDPAAAAKAAAGEVKLTGKNGIIRALNLETNRYAKAGSTVAGLAGLAGALSGNNQLAQKGAQISALNNVARQFGQLPFDAIVVSAKRGPTGELEIGELSMRSPQLTLSGSGTIANLSGRGFADQPLRLSVNLGARGDMASAFQTLGLLAPAVADAPADSFQQLIEPLVFDGSLRQVGTKQATRLLARALNL